MTETLCIPDNALLEVCRVMRAGVDYLDDHPDRDERISDNTRKHLLVWCDEIENLMSLPWHKRKEKQPDNARMKRW